MKKIAVILAVLLALGAGIGYTYYQDITNSNTAFEEEIKTLTIQTGSTFDDLLMQLSLENILADTASFKWVAEQKKFSTIKPGYYRIEKGISNNDLVNKLRSGDQTPVKLVFNGARTPQDIAGVIASQIEADSLSILQALTSEDFASKYGFKKDSYRTMFIPNTYEIWWNTDADSFVSKMAQEYKRFWTSERIAQAKTKGLSQSEVGILASIVKAETAKRNEAPIVAGLYLNRLERGIPLQADPTLIYAAGDFTIRRVLDEHKLINSPYNTYMHNGLPPGPINYPETNYLDAVLYPEDHNYIYMCAKPDFSGYHNFSKSLRQHNIYAAEYHRAIRKAGY
ncbi:MAG: endolytic transglycosylase MltG [Flavobacteriales bacterium]|nr:endolytic transglycosylase MltG [Flavobacteriales bacterium]MDG1781301.1 endolytic transglycosylase MltG [Flavobacteriales bacterium]MDG2245898.1 endolytic transglycosylase MltG [Flavobacteriales bacterium]